MLSSGEGRVPGRLLAWGETSNSAALLRSGLPTYGEYVSSPPMLTEQRICSFHPMPGATPPGTISLSLKWVPEYNAKRFAYG